MRAPRRRVSRVCCESCHAERGETSGLREGFVLPVLVVDLIEHLEYDTAPYFLKPFADMIGYIHNRILQTKTRQFLRAWEVLVPHICKVVDPEVSVPVGRSKLRMRLSHRVPFSLALNPYYDRLLPRLCQALKARKGSLSVIDVGANIGDTVMLISEQVAGNFLCIEPEPEFFSYLKKNTQHNSAIVCVNVAVGDRREKPKSLLMSKEISGSAIIVEGGGISLDVLLEEYPSFKQADVLKIDTDGFDFTVIRGATELLGKNKATLFFEHSPEHCVKVAKENPLDVFGHLAGLGYSRFAFYDSPGYLIGELSIAEKGMIEQLLHYAHISGKFYDILSFHDDRAALRADFMKAEHEFFPLFNRSYLDQFSSI